MIKKLVLSTFVLLGTVAAAFAGGAFDMYPTVGIPANTECLSFGNNGVCNQYRPAGPTGMTGNERIPSDTQLPGGQNPQTVTVPSVLLGGGALQLAAPLTGTSITVTANTDKLLLKPAGTIAALTVVLPAATALLNGQTLTIASTQIVTALTVTPGAGTTVNNTPTAMTAGGGTKLVYSSADTSWYRVQ